MQFFEIETFEIEKTVFKHSFLQIKSRNRVEKAGG